jgi:hypothetical protein
MKNTFTFFTALMLAPLGAFAAERADLPVVDISGETGRHVIVAQGTKTDWQGHPSTLLLPDGKTIFCVWQGRQDGTATHGAPGGLLKRSDDGGLTWSELLDVPANWKQIGRGSPTIHRLVDATGVGRLFVYCRDERRTTFLHAMSEDEGKTWSPMRPLDRRNPADPPITGWTAPISILEAHGPDGRRKHLMWYERSRDGKPSPGVIWQSASYDGGLTWGQSKPVVDKAGASEPAAVRSPDGQQILLLAREQDRQLNSLFSVSNDEGETWSAPQELPLALTGDRHLARYAPDGRLVIVFRPVPPLARDGVGYKGLSGVKDSHFTAWVGCYEDLVAGKQSGYLVKLLHSHAGGDHTYPGLELLPDGTFVATTYIKYRKGPELHSVVSVRFQLAELDAKNMRSAASQEHLPTTPVRLERSTKLAERCAGPASAFASFPDCFMQTHHSPADSGRPID